MPQIKLTYFDVDGGRGEPVRIAFHAAGVDFEDHRIAFPEFREKQATFRFHAVPVMEVDGVVVTQSNGMTRYAGKLAGLYPDDDLQALYCDEVMGVCEDISNAIVRTFGLEGDALQKAREALVEGRLSVYIKGLGELLERGGGKYFADNRLTVADLKVLPTTRWLMSGMLDHVPTDLVSGLSPGVAEHAKRIANEPIVKAYYESRA